MRLEQVNPQQLETLRGWFSTAEDLLAWGGPGLSFPTNRAQFEAELQTDKLASYALVEGDLMVGFGQYYERLNHCHLGRLAIAPNERNRGLGKGLVLSLIDRGRTDLQLRRASLFVLESNSAAIRVYEACGFQQSKYPEPMPLEGCYYMVLV